MDARGGIIVETPGQWSVDSFDACESVTHPETLDTNV